MVLRKQLTIMYYFKSKEKWIDDALYLVNAWHKRNYLGVHS